MGGQGRRYIKGAGQVTMSNVYIVGFIGCGNIGDEAILAGTLQSLREASVNSPIVFSWNPSQTAQEHNTPSLPILAGMRGLSDFASHLHRGDLVLLGGGSLLQDGQRRVVPFWLFRAIMAKLKGCTVVYHAQGVGPIKTTLARWLIRVLVPWTADAYTVRDRASRALLPSVVAAQLVSDPALLLPPLREDALSGRVVVALRNTKHDSQLSELLRALEMFSAEAAVHYIFLPMHLPDDLAVCRQMADLTGGAVYEGPHDVQAVRRLLSSAELVLAMRLHASILASGVGTPSVGLSYDPKVLSFYEELNMQEYVLPWNNEFDADFCGRLLATAYVNRIELRSQVIKQVQLLGKRAELSIPIALAKWRSNH